MTRNLKALGLALVAAFAMSAVVASAAQAEKQYTSTNGHTTGVRAHAADHTAERDKFTAAGSTVTCNVATFESTETTVPTSDLKIVPTYNECKAFGFDARVTMNGCEYTFKTPTTTPSTTHFHAATDLVCPGQNDVVIDIYLSESAFTSEGATLCKVTVEPSTSLTGVVTWTNIAGSPDDVTIDKGTIGNIPYEVTGSFLCPGVGEGTKNNGVYDVAPKTVKGFKGVEQIPIDVG